MDTDPSAPILTLASTNDISALDAASVRTARFDSIIEIGYPSRDAAAQILSTYLHGVPGGESVDVRSVAAHFGTISAGRTSVRSCAAPCSPAIRPRKRA